MSQSRSKVRIELTVLGERIAVEAPKPPDRARLDELLPLLHAIDNAAIDQSVARSGKPISCCKGCSTCCRAQPVPITPPEAYALFRLVRALPEPRRTTVRAAFADRVQRLREAGLFDAFWQRDAALDRDRARSIAQQYFQLGLVCPFLENDACGIYVERPFVCRQYLATTPAELCADPFSGAVETVPMALTPAHATLKIAQSKIGTPQYSIPLVLALEYAEAHREELERKYPSEELARSWIAALAAE